MTIESKTPHVLAALPPNIDYNNLKYSKALLKAHRALAELKGYSFGMPNPLLLLSPAILSESIASSEIENIHTTILEVLQNQLLPESEQNENDKEVLRYREGIIWGYENMSKVSISSRLITGIQTKLMPSSEGYRRLQNAIANTTTKEIIYTPPTANEIPNLIADWEKFVNNTPENIDPLIAAAIAHYQFEAIHPFGDGNGRTGRILIVLHLVKEEILHWPILYISGYINQHRTEYYKLLKGITENGEWENFILFMLEAFYLQAQETKQLLFDILSLFEKMKKGLKENHKRIYSADLVALFFAYPIISPVRMGRELGIHYTTATRQLKELVEGGFLTHQKIGRNQFYINKNLLYLFQEKK